MQKTFVIVIALLIGVGLASGQAATETTTSAARGMGAHRVDSSAEKVTFSGTVEKVQLGAGQGLCYLTVKQGDKEEKVILGSMRYLMSNDFGPKAGDAIKVEGFKLADSSIAAKQIELTGKNKTLALRDDMGRPLWSGGAKGQKGRGQGNRHGQQGRGGKSGNRPMRGVQGR